MVSAGTSATGPPLASPPVAKSGLVHEVAFALVHERLTVPPDGISSSSTVKVTVTGSPSVTVACAVSETLPGPRQVIS